MDGLFNANNSKTDNCADIKCVSEYALLKGVSTTDDFNDTPEHETDIANTIRMILVFNNNVHYI